MDARAEQMQDVETQKRMPSYGTKPAVKPSVFKNKILKHLDPEAVTRLQLRRVEMPPQRKLELPGQPIDQLFFLEEGLASMTTLFQDGSQVETSSFGYESAIGLSALMGTKRSLNAVFMRLAGYGYASPVRVAHAEFGRDGEFQRLVLRYVQAQLTRSTQNAACNARHNHEQRLACWLLICADKANLTTLPLAQEYVSEMLGSTRSTISIAAGALKAKGILDYSRGVITIRDPRGLEQEACECYRVVREHLETVTEFDAELPI